MHEGTGTYMQVICRVYALCRRDECLGDDLPTKDSPCPRREAQGLGPEQTHIELLHFQRLRDLLMLQLGFGAGHSARVSRRVGTYQQGAKLSPRSQAMGLNNKGNQNLNMRARGRPSTCDTTASGLSALVDRRDASQSSDGERRRIVRLLKSPDAGLRGVTPPRRPERGDTFRRFNARLCAEEMLRARGLSRFTLPCGLSLQ